MLAALNSVLTDGRSHAVIFTRPLGAASSAEAAAPPTQWIVTRLEGGIPGVPGDIALVIGLPGLSPFSPSEADAAEQHQAGQRAHQEEITRLHAAIQEAAGHEALARQREARLRAVLELAPCGFLVLDEHARPLYHNAHTATLLGRDLAEGQSIETWLSQGARDEVHLAELSRQWSEGVWRKHQSLPFALTCADGLLKEIEMCPVALPGGGLLVMLHDITEARRNEELLRSTEAKYRALVHECPLPVILADRTAAVFDVNPAAESLLGRTRAEMRRLTLAEWLTEDSITLREEKLQVMQQHDERSAEFAVTLQHENGTSVPAVLRLVIVPDASGRMIFTVHFLSLRRPEPAPVVEAAPPPPVAEDSARAQTHALLLLGTDVHGRITSWSEEAQERFGHSEEEVLGRGLHTIFRPSDATGFYGELLSACQSMGSGEAVPVEWGFFPKGGGRHHGAFLLQRTEGEGLAVDLLEEVQVLLPSPGPVTLEEPVSAAKSPPPPVGATESIVPEPTPVVPSPPAKPTVEELSRERLLLGEAHHRVKNHLQIITSMLNLQLSTLHNDEACDALRSSQNRVRSIAALHQHLYELATTGTADFATFAGQLIGHLRECFEVPESRVQLQLVLPDRTVPEEWLMPLALSLNEMVSNAFKHAFPGGRTGSMGVTLSFDESEGSLTVSDDGAGLPEGFSQHDSPGLGLKILRVFAGQLGGEVKLDSQPGIGTRFELLFPVGVAEAEPVA